MNVWAPWLTPPAALEPGASLDGRAGAGLDPCFAQQLTLELGPGGSAECAFLLGEGADHAEAAGLIARYRQPGAVQAARAARTPKPKSR